MIFRFFTISLLLLSMATDGLSQQITYKLTPIPLDDFQAFLNPAPQWKIVGELKGDFSDTKPKATRGKGILFNDFNEKNLYKPETNLLTKLEHGDMLLSMDFLMPKGSNSGVYFQGRYEIQLTDSWGVKLPKSSDAGGIYERWDESRPEGEKGYQGHGPNMNASFAPNLWQHLEVEFQAPRFDESGKKVQPAKFVKVVLNGVVVHENVVLTGPTRAATFTDEKASGPLMFQGDHGPVAFKNIRYALLNDFKVDFSDVSYQYYEGKFNNDFAAVKPEDLVRSGNAEMIDVKLADDPNNMQIVFSGKFQIKEKGDYQFILKKYGSAKLSIDGDELITQGDWFADQVAAKNLSPGEHTFTVSYIKNFSWRPTGLGLYIAKENSRPMPLHHHASLPSVAPPPLILVKATDEPQVHRSYMYFDGKKKTHVLSVGNPQGVNFSYDLNQATLMQMWRGDFLNATDMWYERGEPQTASAMGAAVLMRGNAPLAVDAPENQLPDTLNFEDLVYKGYSLNSQRQPEFQYNLKGLTFTDLLQPDPTGRGLTRTLRVSDNPKGKEVIVRLAAGESISEVSKNTYAVNNQQYYLQLEPAGKLKPEVKDVKGRKELLVRLRPETSEIRYTLMW